MTKLLLLVVGILVFRRSSKAASTENSHSILTTNINGEGGIDSEVDNTANYKSINVDTTRTQRQIPYGYIGFPAFGYPFDFPFSSQPHYSKRDEFPNTAVYGAEDPLSLIYRRLHEIVKNIRQQSIPHPKPQTPIPAYIPVFYESQGNCGCPTNNQQPIPPINNPTSQPSKPPSSSLKPSNTTMTPTDNTVTIEDRFSEDDDNEDDGSRPINLTPIRPDDTFDVPVPPVDHGTVQAGAEPVQTPTTRRPDAIVYPPPVTVEQSKDDNVPSSCDIAIIKCCSQPQITEKCFRMNRCETPSIYGNPCDSEVQLMVVKKFKSFIERRAGKPKI